MTALPNTIHPFDGYPVHFTFNHHLSSYKQILALEISEFPFGHINCAYLFGYNMRFTKGISSPKTKRRKTMSEQNAVVGIFNTHTEAETSIKELQRAGFDMKKLSIVGKDYHTEEHAIGYYNTGDRMMVWGKLGAFWGGIWGLLFGSALFVLPGIGPLFVFGPLAGWIIGALEGAVVVGSISALAGALSSVGIPNDSVVDR